MLVVISLITLIMSLLLPSLAKSRDAAYKTKCLAALKQIGVGVHAYETDTLGYLPTHHGGGAHPFTTYWLNTSGSKLTRVNLGGLLSYVTEPQYYYDPSTHGLPGSALSLNGPDNTWNESLGNNPTSNDFRLRSSFPARSRQIELGKSGTSTWKLEQFQHKVLYSCFVGVDNWTGGGIINGRIYSPHKRTGNNIMLADTSAHWVPYSVIEAYRPVTTLTPTAIEQHQYYELLDEQH